MESTSRPTMARRLLLDTLMDMSSVVTGPSRLFSSLIVWVVIINGEVVYSYMYMYGHVPKYFVTRGSARC
jgi:hypothetical protein